MARLEKLDTVKGASSEAERVSGHEFNKLHLGFSGLLRQAAIKEELKASGREDIDEITYSRGVVLGVESRGFVIQMTNVVDGASNMSEGVTDNRRETEKPKPLPYDGRYVSIDRDLAPNAVRCALRFPMNGASEVEMHYYINPETVPELIEPSNDVVPEYATPQVLH
jgi:hypothetical protein